MLEVIYDEKTRNVTLIQERKLDFDLSKSDNLLQENEKHVLLDVGKNIRMPLKYNGTNLVSCSLYNLRLTTPILEIPADGISQAIITVQKYKQTHQEDNTIQEEPENSGTEEITFKTTRGKLSTLKLNLVNGQGQFALTSVPETVRATVTASNPDLGRATVDIQFTP